MKYIFLLLVLFACKKAEQPEKIDTCRDVPNPHPGVAYSYKQVTCFNDEKTISVKYTFNTSCSTSVHYEYFREECGEWQVLITDLKNTCN